MNDIYSFGVAIIGNAQINASCIQLVGAGNNYRGFIIFKNKNGEVYAYPWRIDESIDFEKNCQRAHK